MSLLARFVASRIRSACGGEWAKFYHGNDSDTCAAGGDHDFTHQLRTPSARRQVL